MLYDVVVRNIGTVYSGEDRRKARYEFRLYVRLSQGKGSRASGEPVTLMCDGDITAEYNPPKSVPETGPEATLRGGMLAAALYYAAIGKPFQWSEMEAMERAKWRAAVGKY